MGERIRLHKLLARAGVASRRASEELIAAGRVRVDGVTVTRPGTRVDPEAVVEVDGRRVRAAAPVWIALHKPAGTLCTRSDPGGRPTVYDLLPPEHRTLFHVGRLDYLTEGLLLLTNDGDAANALLHPRAATPRRYEVTLEEPVPPGLEARLLAGVELEDGTARAEAARVERGPAARPRLLLTLREGRNREVRRLLEALGAQILGLRRVAIGGVELGALPRGGWRVLPAEEVDRLLAGERARAPRRTRRPRRPAPRRPGTRE